MFFSGLFGFAVGVVFSSSGYFRWRHPAGEPTGFVALSEGLMTGRWAWFRKRPLPPWWMSLPLGILFMAAGVLFMVVSFL
jgi:hypothetical protein